MVKEMGIPDKIVLYLPNCAQDARSGNGTAVRERHGLAPDAPVVLLYTRFFEFDQEKLYFLFEDIVPPCSPGQVSDCGQRKIR